MRRTTAYLLTSLSVAACAISGCGQGTTYYVPVVDGSVLFTRVKLPDGSGYEHAYFRVLRQAMNPEQVWLEWGKWPIKGKDSKVENGRFSSSISFGLATLYWSGNREGYGWFGTSRLVDGRVEEYSTYICVVPPEAAGSLNEAFSRCEFRAAW